MDTSGVAVMSPRSRRQIRSAAVMLPVFRCSGVPACRLAAIERFAAACDPNSGGLLNAGGDAQISRINVLQSGLAARRIERTKLRRRRSLGSSRPECAASSRARRPAAGRAKEPITAAHYGGDAPDTPVGPLPPARGGVGASSRSPSPLCRQPSCGSSVVVEGRTPLSKHPWLACRRKLGTWIIRISFERCARVVRRACLI